MTNDEFRHWLQGFFLLSSDDVSLNTKQLHVIRNHLNLAEAVEGKLDEVNSLFHKRISEIIDSKKETNEQMRSLLTQELRIHLQSIL